MCTALNEGRSFSDAGDAIRTLYAKAAGKSADLAVPSFRAELLDEVPDLVARLAQRADYRWASFEEAEAVRQRFIAKVAYRQRRGMDGWSVRSFTNWLGAFYAFLCTRADEGGYAFLASAIIPTGDRAKTGAYHLRQNGGSRPGVVLGRSPVRNVLGDYLRRNGKPVDEPHLVTGYIAWLHILTTTPIPASATARSQSGSSGKTAPSQSGTKRNAPPQTLDEECRVGVRIVRPAVPGKHGLPAVLDCSALPLDRP